MKPLLLFAIVVGIASSAAAQNAPAPQPAPPASANEGFKAYKSTRLRNIFDPARMRDPVSEGAPSVRTEPGRTPFFALTGTMIRPEKALGFFTGSGPEMNRVIGPGDAIAGYRISNLSVEGAELEKEGARLVLPVGRQIPLDGRNAGTVQPFAPEPPLSSSSSSSPSPSSSSSFPPPPTSDSRSSRSDRDRDRDRSDRRSDRPPKGSSEDVIRKMMERAQRERSSK